MTERATEQGSALANTEKIDVSFRYLHSIIFDFRQAIQCFLNALPDTSSNTWEHNSWSSTAIAETFFVHSP